MNIDLSKSYVIGLIAFLWALTLGLSLQLIFLPYVFPDLHAGDGLLKGADWVWFNQIAVESAHKINETGWDKWELRLFGQAPAGIAAAIYALTGVSKPFMYLPLNAILFGIAVAELHRLISYIAKENKYTWVGVLPLLLFPSSLMIYGQLHKDIFSIVGVFLIFNTLLLAGDQKGWKVYLSFFLRTISGLFLIWIVRPYFMEVVSIAWMAGVSILVLWILWRRPTRYKRLLIIVTGMFFIHQWGVSLSSGQDYYAPPPKANHINSNSINSNSINSNSINSNSIVLLEELLVTYPARFDRVRQNFINGYPNAGSMIDANVRFYSVLDVLNYIPRAIQIGYLAPFPDMWIAQGVNPGSGIMRKISGIEMLVAYAAFIAGFIGLIIKYNNENIIIIAAVLLTGAVILLVQSIAIPNVGTLYRMRLAPWHVTIGLSLYFAFKAFILHRIKK